jgi:hypothetical protein
LRGTCDFGQGASMNGEMSTTKKLTIQAVIFLALAG